MITVFLPTIPGTSAIVMRFRIGCASAITGRSVRIGCWLPLGSCQGSTSLWRRSPSPVMEYSSKPLSMIPTLRPLREMDAGLLPVIWSIMVLAMRWTLTILSQSSEIQRPRCCSCAAPTTLWDGYGPRKNWLVWGRSA